MILSPANPSPGRTSLKMRRNVSVLERGRSDSSLDGLFGTRRMVTLFKRSRCYDKLAEWILPSLGVRVER
jgi:hypothetical protein